MQPPVQSLTRTYNGLTHVLQESIHVSPSFNPSSVKQPLNPQNCGASPFQAIWDTGATNSVVSPTVVQTCGLKPVGVVQVNTANGQRLSQVYVVSIFLPNRVLINNVRVTEGTITGADVLIGMDIITQGDFVITNKNKKTLFSFQMPSVEEIDFVKQAQGQQTPVVSQKIGRNSPCPCGSGKKYKKCHGK